MTKTKTITLNQNQLQKLQEALENVRPEMPEDAKITNELIEIVKLTPFNEGR